MAFCTPLSSVISCLDCFSICSENSIKKNYFVLSLRTIGFQILIIFNYKYVSSNVSITRSSAHSKTNQMEFLVPGSNHISPFFPSYPYVILRCNKGVIFPYILVLLDTTTSYFLQCGTNVSISDTTKLSDFAESLT